MVHTENRDRKAPGQLGEGEEGEPMKRRYVRSELQLIGVYVLVAASAWAGSHAALPKALMEAKTAYVRNDTWHTSVGDQCSEELSKWKRFKLVTDPQEADLVFHLIGSIEDRTKLNVVDRHTGAILWSSKPDKARKILSELRKRIEEQGTGAPE